ERTARPGNCGSTAATRSGPEWLRSAYPCPPGRPGSSLPASVLGPSIEAAPVVTGPATEQRVHLDSVDVVLGGLQQPEHDLPVIIVVVPVPALTVVGAEQFDTLAGLLAAAPLGMNERTLHGTLRRLHLVKPPEACRGPAATRHAPTGGCGRGWPQPQSSCTGPTRRVRPLPVRVRVGPRPRRRSDRTGPRRFLSGTQGRGSRRRSGQGRE